MSEKNIMEVKEYEVKLNEQSQKLKREKAKYMEAIKEIQIIMKQSIELQDGVRKLERRRDTLKAESEEIASKIGWLDKSLAEKNSKLDEITKEVLDKQKCLLHLETYLIKKKEEMKRLETVVNNKTEVQNTGITKMDYKLIEMLFNSALIYVLTPKLTTLFVYHFDLKTIFKHKLIGCGIAAGCGCVQVGNDFYISGGRNVSKMKCSKSLLKINLVQLQRVNAEKRAKMMIAKSQHKLVMLNLVFIYSLGGKTIENNSLSICERYNVNNNKWEYGPSLNEAKKDIGAAAVNGCLIYVFGGMQKQRSATIELLEINNNTTDKWKIIKVIAKEWTARTDAGCFQCSDNEILVFGGIDESNICCNQIFTFSINEGTMVKSPWRLCTKDFFRMSSSVRVKEGVCISGLSESSIHLYSSVIAATTSSESPWTILDTKEWQGSDI
jgi:hypothetical protein